MLFVHLFLVVSLFSVALSSIAGGLFVDLELDVDSAQGDIVGLSGTSHPFSRACLVAGSGYTTRPFFPCSCGLPPDPGRIVQNRSRFFWWWIFGVCLGTPKIIGWRIG